MTDSKNRGPVKPFMHDCVMKTGLCEGNKVSTPVYPNQFEAGDVCGLCGELKATDHDMLVYLYKNLMEGK